MRHDLGDLPLLLRSDENDDVASIVRVTPDADRGRLELVLRIEGFDRDPVWRVVECVDAVRWVLTDATVYGFELADEHPGLIDFTDERGDLYFTGAPSDPTRTAAALREAHAGIVGPLLEFESVINTEAGPLAELLNGGRGKVASGPTTLLREFQGLLESDGARTSLLPTVPRRVWVEREMTWRPMPEELSLLDLGESWVVAQTFNVRPAEA